MNILEKYKKEKEIIMEYKNIKLIEEYSLVSNYGYVVELNGKRYDLRHWLNVYGVDTDYWNIISQYPEEEILNEVVERLNRVGR